MDKFIIFAEHLSGSYFLYVRENEGGICFSKILAHSKIFTEKESKTVVGMMSKCDNIKIKTIRVFATSKEIEEAILDSLENRKTHKKRHSWLRFYNKNNSIEYKCTYCPCVRRSTVNGNSYFLNGNIYKKAPECK